jgi:reactive intermediate/imine deaminase
MTIERYGRGETGPGGKSLPFARAAGAAGWLHVSGQVPMQDGEIVEGGIVAQTHATFANIKAILSEYELDLPDVVKVTVWLADSRDFWPFNKVYADYFGDTLPARSCVRADMMVDCKVEIEVIAYVGAQRRPS